MPASNGKLATSAAALDLFGPDATFKTYLALDGDDLWIVGTGDPGPGDASSPRSQHHHHDLARSMGRRSPTRYRADQGRSRLLRSHVRRRMALPKLEPRLHHRLVRRPHLRPEFQQQLHRPHDQADRRRLAGHVQSHTADARRESARAVQDRRRPLAGCRSRERPQSLHRQRRDDAADGSQERSDRQPRCVLRGRPPHAPGEQGDHHRRQHPRADKPLGGSAIPPTNKIVATHETRISDALKPHQPPKPEQLRRRRLQDACPHTCRSRARTSPARGRTARSRPRRSSKPTTSMRASTSPPTARA